MAEIPCKHRSQYIIQHKKMKLSTFFEKLCQQNVSLKYDKKEMLDKFDKRLKEIEGDCRTSIVDFSKYKLVMLR